MSQQPEHTQSAESVVAMVADLVKLEGSPHLKLRLIQQLVEQYLAGSVPDLPAPAHERGRKHRPH